MARSASARSGRPARLVPRWQRNRSSRRRESRIRRRQANPGRIGCRTQGWPTTAGHPCAPLSFAVQDGVRTESGAVHPDPRRSPVATPCRCRPMTGHRSTKVWVNAPPCREPSGPWHFCLAAVIGRTTLLAVSLLRANLNRCPGRHAQHTSSTAKGHGDDRDRQDSQTVRMPPGRQTPGAALPAAARTRPTAPGTTTARRARCSAAVNGSAGVDSPPRQQPAPPATNVWPTAPPAAPPRAGPSSGGCGTGWTPVFVF